MRAFNVTFTDSPAGPGKAHSAEYHTAVVVARDVSEAARRAEQYCKDHFPGLHLEEIRLGDNCVIL